MADSASAKHKVDVSLRGSVPPASGAPGARGAADPAPAAEETSTGSLGLEAEALCASLERVFRRAYGDMPKSSDLAEVRAQQAAIQDLVRRAAESGAGAQKQLAALSAEREQLKDAAARARADFLNYQARTTKDLQRAEELALRGYVAELLPILDSMDLSLIDARSEGAELSRVREALELINQSLNQVLKVRGLERMATVGQPFDPKRHEPAHVLPPDAAAAKGQKPNTVVEEIRAGYLWKGLILRAAQVVATSGTEPGSKAAEKKS